MYNRYIPQPDGSYRKNPMQEPRSEPDFHQPPTPKPPPPPIPMPQPTGCNGCPNRQPPRPQKPKPPTERIGILGFLKQLLPGDFDAEDLLVVLLLLLMAGDCPEDPNSALLTLALYLFL